MFTPLTSFTDNGAKYDVTATAVRDLKSTMMKAVAYASTLNISAYVTRNADTPYRNDSRRLKVDDGNFQVNIRTMMVKVVSEGVILQPTNSLHASSKLAAYDLLVKLKKRA